MLPGTLLLLLKQVEQYVAMQASLLGILRNGVLLISTRCFHSTKKPSACMFRYNNNPVETAAARGRGKSIRRLIEEDGVDVNSCYGFSRRAYEGTALHIAAKFGGLDVARDLVGFSRS